MIEFRSDKWAEIYAKRIDETVAALKSKGVPVFWVGLPSIRGTHSTADAIYLNDLYRARAERAGAHLYRRVGRLRRRVGQIRDLRSGL